MDHITDKENRQGVPVFQTPRNGFAVPSPSQTTRVWTSPDNEWKVTTVKKPILNSSEIDAATEKLGIPIPEMIFGNNQVKIENVPSGLCICFSALDALDLVDKTGSRDGLVKVAYAKEWMDSREKSPHINDDVKGIVKPFDWTYTSAYKGDTTVKGVLADPWVEDKDVILPMELLSRPDPILFFDDVCLYEDELGDNGIANFSVKIRVMPERLLLLSRLFIRVDDVLFRVRDTRIFVEFSQGVLVREYKAHEETYDKVKKRVPIGSQDYSQNLRDSNWVVKNIACSKTVHEIIELRK
ncbi:Tip41p [Sugiyamaella lignohabitans]|uniref:Tip41p n=1 Tax=Sugiyamaella lignohabitans TaxID=796027 RepID=A0A167C2N3_9ASCO|nr:Tip41p [Sugiyamaella lignohabitans]ANB11145.1 Tip41p [Sugiyamaella lignohabitans]